MNENLISDFDMNDIDKNLMFRNGRLVLIMFILSLINSLLDLISVCIKLLPAKSPQLYKHFFYTFRILPVITVGCLGLIILSHFFYYKALITQSTAINKSDSILFNAGQSFFKNSLILWTAYLIILIVRYCIDKILYWP